MLILAKSPRRVLVVGGFLVLSIWGFPAYSILGADYSSRLASGEIIVHSGKVPDSAARRGEATGVVAAPPEKVWEVVTDANHFPEFLPKMIKSRLVRFEELKRILQERPFSAAAVEAILGSGPPPDLAHFRVPGRKYLGYHYGHLEVPWPLRDRWYIVRVQWDESEAARRRYTCSWSLMIGNLREYRGEWKVEPFGDWQTQLTYRVVTDPGGFVPKSIVEEFTAQTLPQIIAGVRRRASYR